MKRYEARELLLEAGSRGRREASPAVTRIVNDVKARGDEAVREYTRLLDGCAPARLRVPEDRIKAAEAALPEELKNALKKAVDNLRRFSSAQLEGCRDFEFEIEPGVTAGQRAVPIRRVGIYAPGGRFPLISSLLMAAVPAAAAGVDEIAACSPPRKDGEVPSLLLGAAGMAGVTEFYRMGGAQAVAAFAFGTGSVPAVDKIVGPGNRFVTAAKSLIYGRAGIDFPAGPTEILIIADGEADPALAAADLLAQAEHDSEARGFLLATDGAFLDRVEREIDRQLGGNLEGGGLSDPLGERIFAARVSSAEEAMALADRLAPEHVQVLTADPAPFLTGLRNYGSLFLGSWSAEVLGDYSSGLNHVLPTGGASRYTGGLSVRDFLKFQTVLQVTRDGFARIGPAAEEIARAEGLFRHAAAVSLRSGRAAAGGEES
jgi:histidinol dehydrogenase